MGTTYDPQRFRRYYSSRPWLVATRAYATASGIGGVLGGVVADMIGGQLGPAEAVRGERHPIC